MIPQYSTKLFSEIWSKAEDFTTDYSSIGIPTKITTENATTLFYLLYAKYGNNPIANEDINQFKYKVFSIIYMSGPAWEKKLEIQDTLRGMSEEDLMKGTKQIFNHSYNPSTEPSTSTLEELLTINDQNAHNVKRGRLDAYAFLIQLLEEDVTSSFLDKFKGLFKSFVRPENPLLYESED